jgi:hypothetical protein
LASSELARRAVARALGEGALTRGDDRVELQARDASSTPSLMPAEPIGVFGVRDVAEPTATGFMGFVDGVQRHTVLGYLHGTPVVHGVVAAGIRVRDAETRRMQAWLPPQVMHFVFAVRSAFDTPSWDALEFALRPLSHHLRAVEVPTGTLHPSAMLAAMLTSLGTERDALELDVAREWSRERAHHPLYVDGALRLEGPRPSDARLVGVIKSHASLRVTAEQVRTVLSLPVRHRTTVLRRSQHALTWYLRLRPPAGHDPFFGLVRIEVGGAHDEGVEAVADEVSGWVLAERSPVAKPDGRWDVMPYAVRDVERWLRASV